MSEQASEIIENDEPDDDFDSGFASGNESANSLTETPEKKSVDRPSKQAEKPAPAIKYAQVTEDQLNNILASVASFNETKSDFQKKLDSAFGTIGNLKQILAQHQANTQQGKPVELDAQDVAEISAMYPELGASMLKDLQKVAAKLKGTGTAAPAFDESKIDQRVMHHLQPNGESLADRIKNEIAAEDLAETYPNWREITGPKDSNTEFRQWLKAQPDGYGERVLNSSRAKVIADAITKFQASKNPPAKQTNKRSERFAAAVAPKSAGGHGSSSQEEDEFDIGFKNARSH